MIPTLSPSDRIAALQRIDADLAWLMTPHRPPCPTCDGASRVDGRICGRCDGIGSLDPPEKVSPLGKARQILLDAELQSAIIRAQRPEGATKPTEGSTAWSDPTGDLAVSEAAVELRASEILRNWFAGIDIAHEAIRHLSDLVRDQLGEPEGPRWLSASHTFAAIHWLLIVPHDRLSIALRDASDELRRECDHAIHTAAEAAQAVRHGRPAYRGKLSPSVNGVLEAARRVTSTAPPKPKQLDRLYCTDCAKHGVQSDVADNSRNRCAKCLRFRKEYRVPPTAAIVRAWDAGRERLTPGMIAEAKGRKIS